MDAPALERLFVYGTLAPGRVNAHLLEAVGGAWEAAWVRGRLYPEGWGAALGYPALVLDPSGARVDGFVFSSDRLAAHWPALDDFEGDAYRRVRTTVTRANGSTVEAFVYVLRHAPPGPG